MPGNDAKKIVPVSLEGERRKAMMMIHSVEKEINSFKEKYFRKPRNPFNEITEDYVAFVLEKTGTSQRPPKDYKEFAMYMNKVRASAVLLYKTEQEQVDCALDRARAFDELVSAAKDRLMAALNNHVAKFCLSFSAEAGGIDIKCVQEYENSINRWWGAIKEGSTLLEDIIQSLADHSGTTFQHYVRNYGKILHYMGLSLEVFPRIYNPMKDWVTADEAYARKVTDEMNTLLKRKLEITENSRRQLLRAEDMQHKIQRKTYQTKKLQGRLYDAMDERKFFRKQEMALVENYAKVEGERARKKLDLDETLQRLYTRETNSRAYYDKLVSITTVLQEDISKLEKRLETLKWNLLHVRKQRYATQKEVHKLQVMYDKSLRTEHFINETAESQSLSVKDMHEEYKELGDRIDVLRRIRSIKLHPNTIKKIHREGYTHGSKMDVTDRLTEAFRLAAPDIGKDWAYLYQKLPFSPVRDFTTRTHDIELIDLISQRHDLGQREIAMKSLERWKRLSHSASVTSLVKTLRSMKKTDIAQKIENHLLTNN